MTYWNGSGWETDRPASPPRPKRGRRFLGAATEAGIITLLMFGLIAGTALAAPGGGKGGGGKATAGGSLALVMVADANGDGVPNYMDSVTFDIVQSTTDLPMVGLRCYQGSSFVHDGYVALYDASWLAKHFTLGSGYWDPAQDSACMARLFYYDRRGREKVLATLDFAVAP